MCCCEKQYCLHETTSHLQRRVEPVYEASCDIAVVLVKQLVANTVPGLFVGLGAWWEGRGGRKEREGEVIISYYNMTFTLQNAGSIYN